MAQLKVSYILLIFFIFSCSAEKINLSPVGKSSDAQNNQQSLYTFDERKNITLYSSEITNLISSFPKFRNQGVNAEVSNLKLHLKDYIGAVLAYNMLEQQVTKKNVEKSYKKLQNMRKFLNQDDDAVLNRYLVRIKTNLNFLTGNVEKDSTSTLKK